MARHAARWECDRDDRRERHPRCADVVKHVIRTANLPPGMGAKMSTSALIVGKVEYREGDGANMTIRPGPCEVDVTTLDATISWSEGEYHGSAAIPIADYRRYLSGKALRIVEPTQS